MFSPTCILSIALDRYDSSVVNLYSRCIIFGRLNNKHWTAVYAMRGAKIRMISVRRSREKEVQLYDNKKNS
ncbi:MAG: BrnT family toxin [Nitrospirae bacterium]|nr:BrnT family toxin [Nitrospirota bacterium]